MTDPVASLPPLRDVIRQSGLSAKKSLGQNFLLDLNVTRRIARAAAPLSGKTILEIGPGPGGLTRALLLEGAGKVIVLERDERFRPALTQIEENSQGRLATIFADALGANYQMIAAETGASRIVANLPYNIATALIVDWLTVPLWPPWFDKLVIMVQREVGERLVAEKGSENYGRLAIITQVLAQPRILFTLPPSVFTPSPKVSSALVEIIPNQSEPAGFSIACLERVTAAAFGQRRKMLRSSLSSLGVDTAQLLLDCEIEPSLRAEQLATTDFVRLARHLEKMQAQDPGSPRP